MGPQAEEIQRYIFPDARLHRSLIFSMFSTLAAKIEREHPICFPATIESRSLKSLNPIFKCRFGFWNRRTSYWKPSGTSCNNRDAVRATWSPSSRHTSVHCAGSSTVWLEIEPSWKPSSVTCRMRWKATRRSESKEPQISSSGSRSIRQSGAKWSQPQECSNMCVVLHFPWATMPAPSLCSINRLGSRAPELSSRFPSFSFFHPFLSCA